MLPPDLPTSPNEVLTLVLPPKQYAKLDVIARERDTSMREVVTALLNGALAREDEARRKLKRASWGLFHGLGS